MKVKQWWFCIRSKQLMKELHPEVDFKLSPGWFDCFKGRAGISLRHTTSVSQKQPSDLEIAIRQFTLTSEALLFKVNARESLDNTN